MREIKVTIQKEDGEFYSFTFTRATNLTYITYKMFRMLTYFAGLKVGAVRKAFLDIGRSK